MTDKLINPENSSVEFGILDKDSPEFINVRSFSDKFNRENSITFEPNFFDWQYQRPQTFFQMDDAGFYFCKNNLGQITGYCSASNAPYLWKGKEVTGRFFHEWYSDPTQSGPAAALLARQLESAPILQVMGASANTLSILFRMRPFLWFPLKRLCAVLDPEKTSLLIDNEGADPYFLLTALRFQASVSVDRPFGKQIQTFDDGYQDIWGETSRNFIATVNKSSQYMNWRYVDHPIFSYYRHVYDTSRGERVYIVWRAEHIRDKAINVARICEIIGSLTALPEAIPSFVQDLIGLGIVFADFFCTNDAINKTLTTIGFCEVIPLEELDIPRLFSPLQKDFRKTLHSAISVSPDHFSEDFHNISEFYFTKGDTNQDMPNR